jgi:SAM-dependent methyltransferase
MLNLRLLAAKIRTRVHDAGFLGAIRLTAKQSVKILKSSTSAPDEFDSKHGTDTAGSANLWRYQIASTNAQHGAFYGTQTERHIRVLLDPIPREVIFLDLGCGKGRPLMIAAEMQFQTIIGVEFVRELADIARNNLRKTATRATVLDGDAAIFEFPSGPLAVYLYNPFAAAVMSPVVRRLRSHEGDLWVVYVNPRHAALFDEWMNREPLKLAQAEVFAPESVAIWHGRKQ